jgi:hypothetical protein
MNNYIKNYQINSEKDDFIFSDEIVFNEVDLECPEWRREHLSSQDTKKEDDFIYIFSGGEVSSIDLGFDSYIE